MTNTDTVDAQYTDLVHEVLKYIEEIKKIEKDVSLVDIICDFSVKKDIPIEIIGDAISADQYFKSFIEKDCEFHNIFRTKNEVEEW